MKFRRTGLLLLIALGLFGGAPVSAVDPLAVYRLGRGWATFGLVLPAGAARGAVAVGTLATQTDVKTTWPDGSIRFAVVTTRVPAAGSYPITAAAPVTWRPSPAWPSASVDFVIGKDTWSAALPAPLSEYWLAGPMVREARALVAPMRGGVMHPFLRVIFDVRVYEGGATRLDVTVENALDVASADSITYDATISLGGQPLFRQTAVQHQYLARWRRIVQSGFDEAAVTPDFTPFIRAGALPEYLPLVESPLRSTKGPQFDILKTGDLMIPMNAHGGRPEIAPYPDWTAQYLVHKRADQRDYVIRHGELAGSFGIHIKEAEGVRLISIDTHPNYWLDARADPDGRPKNGLRGVAVAADTAHQPSLAYVPYLVTGDRFFVDEMKYWANFSLLWTFQDSYSKQRGGSDGLLAYNEVRGIGWALRNLVDLAAYLPDTDTLRDYFRQKVGNNLVWFDKYSAEHPAPFETLFPGRRPEDEQWQPYSWMALWEHIYLAWALDHAYIQGFGPGTSIRDRVVRLQLRLFTSEHEGFPRTHAGAYVLAVGRRNGNRVEHFKSLAEVFKITEQFGNFRQFEGYYGPEARLMLLIAIRQQLAGAPEAYQYLMSHTGPDSISMKADLARRSGWALGPDHTSAGTARAAVRQQ